MITKDPLTLLRDALTEARDALVDATISTCNDYDAHVGRINTALAMTADASDPAPTLDPVVEANRALLHQRSQVGLKKYGVPLAGTSLTECELMTHALEEALDLANYLQAILQRRATRPAPVVATPAVEGWQWVPIDPTVEMMDGAFDNISLSAAHTTYGVTQHVWDYMLAHAPAAPILSNSRELESAAPVVATPATHLYATFDEWAKTLPEPVQRNFKDGAPSYTEMAWNASRAAAPAAPTAGKFSMTPALRKAVTEWGYATNGCEDADVHLLEVLNAMATAAPETAMHKTHKNDLKTAETRMDTSFHGDAGMAPAAPIEEGKAHLTPAPPPPPAAVISEQYQPLSDRNGAFWQQLSTTLAPGTKEQAKPEPVEAASDSVTISKAKLMQIARSIIAEELPDCDEEFMSARAHGVGSFHAEILSAGAVDADKGGE